MSPYLLESTLLPIPTDENGKMKFEPQILDSLLSRYASIAIGMGWGSSDSYKEILSYLLQNAKQPLIIDADGLNTLSKMNLDILKEAKASVILTPHMMEFSRLSGLSISKIESDPITHAKAFAKEYGVVINFENLPFIHLPINNCKQILDFVKWVDRDNFKVCLDTGHALVSGEQPGEAVRLFGKEYLRTLHVHDNDGTGDYHKLPGDGIGDWVDFGKALNEIGFDGALSLETMVHPRDLTPEEWDAKARELYATAKRISEYR